MLNYPIVDYRPNWDLRIFLSFMGGDGCVYDRGLLFWLIIFAFCMADFGTSSLGWDSNFLGLRMQCREVVFVLRIHAWNFGRAMLATDLEWKYLTSRDMYPHKGSGLLCLI